MGRIDFKNVRATYLLGAGASAKIMPTYNTFSKEFKVFSDSIKSSIDQFKGLSILTDDNTYSLYNSYHKLIDDIAKIDTELMIHLSPDTLARKYFLKNEITKLSRLKLVLNLFFKYLHFNKKKLDDRYDAFFSMIFNREKDIITTPEKINILTWNYDIMLELSLCGFFNHNYLQDVERDVQIFPNCERNNSFITDQFSIFKLNGTSGLQYDPTEKGKRDFTISDFSTKRDNEFNNDLVAEYKTFRDETNLECFGINYAWEENSMVKKTRIAAKKATSKTNVLVVIGYSFPNFNREIDRDLITNMPHLHEVYIQDTDERVEKIKKKFVEAFLLPEEKVKTVVEDKEFYIPYL